jgi:deazaflavin-dependent oxidoreductase (nitroreductase family)
VRSRRSGKPIRTAVGFLEQADGTLLVAAGEPDADWALNLLALGTAMVTIGDLAAPYDAVELTGPERHAAISGLILRYGTPAEGLGRGPAFRLTPVASVVD